MIKYERQCFPLTMDSKQGCPLLALLLNSGLELLASTTRQENMNVKSSYNELEMKLTKQLHLQHHQKINY